MPFTCAALLCIAWGGSAAQAAVLFGPTPYLSPADIPGGFYAGGPTVLEHFEGGSLHPSISASTGSVISSVITPVYAGLIDSVDGDDGSIVDVDTGFTGHSWFSLAGATGVTFTFVGMGPLPTAFGMVWTDGAGTTIFEAFGPGMVSLGTIGPVAIADGVFSGTTGEDRFFGVHNPGGVLAIKLSNTSGGIEIDHVQYGFAPSAAPVPEPASLTLFGLGSLGLAFGAARKRKRVRAA